MDYEPPVAARDAALSECGADCSVVLTFNRCGAYAADQGTDSTAVGWGQSFASAPGARQAALAECRLRGGSGRIVRVWGLLFNGLSRSRRPSRCGRPYGSARCWRRSRADASLHEARGPRARGPAAAHTPFSDRRRGMSSDQPALGAVQLPLLFRVAAKRSAGARGCPATLVVSGPAIGSRERRLHSEESVVSRCGNHSQQVLKSWASPPLCAPGTGEVVQSTGATGLEVFGHRPGVTVS